jgi:8-oxo-dGTP diphosphatase
MDSSKSNQQSPTTTLPVVEVVAAIIFDNNQILATQRGYGKWRGWWEFPGGKIQQGESREKALIREIKEELDAEIVIDRFHATVDYNYPEFHLTMHCYLCHFLNGNYTLKEHLSARWLSADSLNTVQWLPADLNLVAELSQLMQFEKK